MKRSNSPDFIFNNSIYNIFNSLIIIYVDIVLYVFQILNLNRYSNNGHFRSHTCTCSKVILCYRPSWKRVQKYVLIPTHCDATLRGPIFFKTTFQRDWNFHFIYFSNPLLVCIYNEIEISRKIMIEGKAKTRYSFLDKIN